MADYTFVTVIYNPKSTGPGERLSRDLEKRLKKSLPKQSITCVGTTHRGHAREIAYEAALATSRPLIISASGDGGYNEVINGVMQAQQEKPTIQPTTGLLAAGNANDHFNSVHQDDLVKLIEKGQEQMIDVLKLAIKTPTKTTVRYAHSYIGLGLTPQVGLELNKTSLNKLNETWISLRAIALLRPVRIRISGHTQIYSSLIFSNIDRMAKYLTLSKDSSINDGKFEVISFRFINKIRLISMLLKASTIGLDSQRHVSHFAFSTIKRTAFQVDGEILNVAKESQVTVSAEQRVLRCIV